MRYDSERWWVMYVPPNRRATFARATISSVERKRSGTYWRDVERPRAPSFIASATSASIRASSSAVARRSPAPTTRPRTPPAPTNVPRLIAGRAFSNAAK